MKSFISSCCCLLFMQFSAQVIEQKNATITNTNTPQTENTKEENSLQDSTVQDQYRIESISKKNKSTKKADTKSTISTQDTVREKKASSFYTVKSTATTQSTQRSPSPMQQTEMNNTVSYYESSTPNSFECHYFKFVAGNYNVDLINDLLEAQKLKPNNVDVQVQLAAYNFIKSEDKKLAENLEFLLKNKKIEAELLLYAEDLLNSIEENGTLITHGFDDTYSVMYLQKVKKTRTDVNLLSLDFMQSEFYRTKLSNEKFTLPNSNLIDINFLKAFCESNPSKKLHLSMTFPKPYLSAVIGDLQISGLTFAYKYDTESLKELNAKFYKKISSKSQLTKFESEKCKSLSSNYLPVLYSLKKEFEDENKKEDLNDIQTKIDKIYIQAKINQRVNSYK